MKEERLITINILDCGPSLIEVTNQFGHSPNWIKAAIKGNNINFKWIKAYKYEDTIEDNADGWIITGSPSSVYEEIDWMLKLEDKIRYLKRKGAYILGICFGHQLIAKSLGGKVVLNPNGWELGSYNIKLTSLGMKSSILSGLSNFSFVYQSHRDCVKTLPIDAIELANNNKGIQAFSINDKIFGTQFHPEFTPDIIKKYVEIRKQKGILSDSEKISKINDGALVLQNFIKLVSL